MPDSAVTALRSHLQQIHNPAVKTAKTRVNSKNLDSARNKTSRKQTGVDPAAQIESARS